MRKKFVILLSSIIVLVTLLFLLYHNFAISDRNKEAIDGTFVVSEQKKINGMGNSLYCTVECYNGFIDPLTLNNVSAIKTKRYASVPGFIPVKDNEVTLRFKVESNVSEDLVLRLPMIGTSYRIWQDEILLGEVVDARVGDNPKDTYIYENFFVLKATKNKFYITLNVTTNSNKLALRENIYIGTMDSVMKKRYLFHTIDYVLIGGLLFTAIYSMILYIVLRKRKINNNNDLLFCMFLITTSLAIRAILATDVINGILYPLIGRIMAIKIFNISSDVTFIGGILFLSKFYEEENSSIGRFFTYSYMLFILLESIYLNIYVATLVNIFNIITFIYLVYLVVKGNNKAKENRVLSIGVFLSLVFILYDILYYVINVREDRVVKSFSYSSICVYLFIIPACITMAMKFVDNISEKNVLYEKNLMITRELSDLNDNFENMMYRTKELEESVSEITAAYKEVEELSNRDPLTSLSNRRHFMKIIKLLYSKKDDKFAIIIGDIDNFKKINDKYGHNFGDTILKEVANILSRYTKIVARWGGEEFIICIQNTKQNRIEAILNNIMDDIRGVYFKYNEDIIKISMTFGVYLEGDYFNLIKSINNADISLYHGKETGKDKIVFYHEM